MPTARTLSILLFFAIPLLAGKKKDETQVLELPKEPPLAVAAETRRLVFHTSPLSAKGLLSQQTKDAIKAVLKINNGATVVKIRAFVAGRGDMRRVPSMVSETFTEKKLPLPAVSVVQVGGLPLEGAQVVLETIAVAKKETNPSGVLFVGGQLASVPAAMEPTMPLAQKSLEALDGKLEGAEPLRVTCFTSSLEEAPKLSALLASRYPNAATDVVEVQRAIAHSAVECEGTARLTKPGPFTVEYRKGGGAVAVAAFQIAFTGTQIAFGLEEKDARLAFQRLDKALQPLGTSTKQTLTASIYPLSQSIADYLGGLLKDVFPPPESPALTMIPFEGLPSLDASFAADVAAVIHQ